jgi:CxxC motif-containing protein (DUF1111 family)
MTERLSRLPALAALLAAPVLVSACGPDDPEPPKLATGIYAALGAPLPSASADQMAAFARGKDVATRVFTPADGLGPGFNLTSCGGCHEKPVFGGSAGRYRDFQLVGRTLSDGSHVPTGTNGVQKTYAGHGEDRVATDADTNVIATRNPIPFFGAGLMAEIPDDAILAHADPDDRDGDGISGRPNYDRGFVGRFGRKSQTVSLEGFVRGPLFNHLGLTSTPLSDADKARLPVPSGPAARTSPQGLTGGWATTSRGQAAAPDEPTTDDDGVADPELSSTDLFDLVSFVMLMAAPEPEAPNATTQAGEKHFTDYGCAKCHVPSLAGPRGLIPLYSDLLLHDMGDALADGIPMKEATGREFRTQPLWGIVAVGPYLHDGRADTLDEAIRLHGGEGLASRDAYAAASEADRAAVITFLESLGGKAQRSDGLLPPDAAIPAVGDWAGPWRALSTSEQEQFLRGRAFFDRDVAHTAGLGPRFNGDSCRACHFAPTIGGAGPADVDVIRHGILGTSTSGAPMFTAPKAGTLLHRFATEGDERPEPEAGVNLFEPRQTPHTLGLGRIDAIPEATILAREDPTDADGDGIRGIAHRLSDGRLGRFGWKAGVPSVAEFARDATFNELGLSLAPQAGLSFGLETDDDEVADPEASATQLEDLAFYLSMLAPPPRSASDAALEARGEALFAQVGCDACHVPTMDAEDGQPVRLYSDLLLHDVQADDFVGVPDGPASMRHFRTPPLWGIAKTGPYMHDGAAWTIEASIAAHDAEARTSRLAVEALSASDRAALLAFLASL